MVSCWVRDWTRVSCIGGWIPYHWARRHALKMNFSHMRTSMSSHHGVTGIGFTLPSERFKNKSKKQTEYMRKWFSRSGYQTVGGLWFPTNRKRLRWALLFTSLTGLREILDHGTGGTEGEAIYGMPQGILVRLIRHLAQQGKRKSVFICIWQNFPCTKF